MTTLGTIPNDPRIRDAERYGFSNSASVKCPICGEECVTIYKDLCGNEVGCENCLTPMESLDWAEEAKERAYYD